MAGQLKMAGQLPPSSVFCTSLRPLFGGHSDDAVVLTDDVPTAKLRWQGRCSGISMMCIIEYLAVLRDYSSL